MDQVGPAVDSFARDNLPLSEDWPQLNLEGAFAYPERLNCVVELLDRWVERGEGARACIRAAGVAWRYADLLDKVDRIARVLTERHGLVPGGRVLLRAPNTPMMVAAYLAVIKAGGIAVATMPLLRARELAYMLEKARIGIALGDHRLMAALHEAAGMVAAPPLVLAMGGEGDDDLIAEMAGVAPGFVAYPSRADDLCLIAFTSGTTGEPKGTMHFHRDMLAICDGYGSQVLKARPDDLFIGTAPLAFTFGLGAVVLFPLRIGRAPICWTRLRRRCCWRRSSGSGRRFVSRRRRPIGRCWACGRTGISTVCGSVCRRGRRCRRRLGMPGMRRQAFG